MSVDTGSPPDVCVAEWACSTEKYDIMKTTKSDIGIKRLKAVEEGGTLITVRFCFMKGRLGGLLLISFCQNGLGQSDQNRDPIYHT